MGFDLATPNSIQHTLTLRRYVKKFRFEEIADALGLEMKGKHTIIEKWPLRLNLGPRDEGGKEAFTALLASGHSGIERYVEWKRI